MTYNTDRTNLWKRKSTWYFRKSWRDKSRTRRWYIVSLETHSLTVARKRHDEIMGRWDEVMEGSLFDWSWQGEYNRTTVKERRLDDVV